VFFMLKLNCSIRRNLLFANCSLKREIYVLTPFCGTQTDVINENNIMSK
jgi:hypothetical protein